jgi:glucosylglycerate phosphorylase
LEFPESGIRQHLKFLYGEEKSRGIWKRLQVQLEDFHNRYPALKEKAVRLSQRDAILITYGDQVRQPDVPPLDTLARIANEYLGGVVSGIHILPFFPYSSDDGFSVIDYRQVNPDLGSWADISHLGLSFRLMFDAVINHISVQSIWFRSFMQDDAPYSEYFITVPPGTDLSMVVRPRALPLLTEFTTPSGPKLVWTTFSEDQVDLNYAYPDVLLDIIDVLLTYVAHGAEFIRLDAIAYLWKEIGSPSIHLPQTHSIIQIFRQVLDAVAPYVMLITETNVPHQDNVSYFGDGTNEAQLVYNFALPPLTLHALHTGNAQVLSQWASGLSLPSAHTTFFNFLASHDGIGLNPARGILPESEIENIVKRVQAHSGLVSYKTNPDGSQSPYELNVNYFDALSDPKGDEPLNKQVDRFVVAHAIMLSLIGVPGIYFHSLFGSRGWPEGVAQTGHNRTINRQKLTLQELESELVEAGSLRNQIYHRLARLLEIRSAHGAFHPHGSQQVIDCSPAVFTLFRVSPHNDDRVLCLHNISDQVQRIEVNLAELVARRASDLIGDLHFSGEQIAFDLSPYQVCWFKLQS